MIGGGCLDCTGAGAGTGAAGLEGAGMSKRSPMLLFVVGGLLADVGGDAGEKSPKPLLMLSFLACMVVDCAGGEACFGGGAGFVSKKEPPLSTPLGLEAACLAWAVEFIGFEKADGLG